MPNLVRWRESLSKTSERALEDLVMKESALHSSRTMTQTRGGTSGWKAGSHGRRSLSGRHSMPLIAWALRRRRFLNEFDHSCKIGAHQIMYREIGGAGDG